MWWHPEQWWAGQTAVVIGGGDSLRGFDWRRLRSFLTVGCNNAFELGPSICTVCVFGDLKWFNLHQAALEAFPNPVVTNQPFLCERGPEWLLTVPREPQGLSRERLTWGGNTGCIALSLALLLGAVRIYLIGFDMKLRNKQRANWHDKNAAKPNPLAYDRFKRGFEEIAKALPNVYPGREVINLGPDSDLDCFPRAELDKVIPLFEEVGCG